MGVPRANGRLKERIILKHEACSELMLHNVVATGPFGAVDEGKSIRTLVCRTCRHESCFVDVESNIWCNIVGGLPKGGALSLPLSNGCPRYCGCRSLHSCCWLMVHFLVHARNLESARLTRTLHRGARLLAKNYKFNIMRETQPKKKIKIECDSG